MKTMRILLHSLVLIIINLTTIIIGFFAHSLLSTGNQIATQVPIAFLTSILLFFVWTGLINSFPSSKLTLHRRSEIAATFVCSLLWAPAVFIPVHYITQGYLTGIANIIALILFQLPTNATAILIACRTQNTELTIS